MDERLQRERELLRVLAKSHESGDLSDEQYEAAMADVLDRITELSAKEEPEQPPSDPYEVDSEDRSSAECDRPRGVRSPPPPPGFKKGCIWVFVAVVVVVSILLIRSCSSTAGRTPSPERAQTSARTACEMEVERQLKDPGSAEFSDVTIEIVSPSEPFYRYSITGTVRAANSFGGTAAHSFECDATYSIDSREASSRATIR